ncbi:hypothetical protein F0457_01185 [Salmonella enterica]|nr:hypothetical protein [Salmonella enterica]ECQ9688604.1 hypothetical protein [Salmonella enterica]EDI6053247.1 hypothetical protein [Salmonella enterica subsp. enterica serovar Typhimurium]
MPTYKQVVNHVKKHVLWKDEYFERYYRLNPELVQKRLDKIYQAEDDLMVLISTQSVDSDFTNSRCIRRLVA